MKKSTGRPRARKSADLTEQIREIRRGIEDERKLIRLRRKRAARKHYHEAVEFLAQLRAMRDHPLFKERLEKPLQEIIDALSLRLCYGGDFKGRPVSSRENEVINELALDHRIAFEKAALNEARERGVSYNQKRTRMHQLEKVRYGRRQQTLLFRQAADFLRALRLSAVWEQEPGNERSDTERINQLAPLLDALPPNRQRPEFLIALADAMQISLSERQAIKRRLLEIPELLFPHSPKPHWRKILQEHCPDYKDTPQNFQHLLSECGVDYDIGEFRVKGHRYARARKRVKKRTKKTR